MFGFWGLEFLVGIVVTHANILSSHSSTPPRGWGFGGIRMLSYLPHLLTIHEQRPGGIYYHIKNIVPAQEEGGGPYRRYHA